MNRSWRGVLALVLSGLVVWGATLGAATAQAAEVRPGIAAEVAAGGRITGTVTAPPGGDLAMEAVMVFRWEPASVSQPGQWVSFAFADVRTDGTYATDVLPAGTYRVGVFASRVYAASFYPAAGSVYDASDVVVDDGDLAGIDMALTAGATIAGSITTASGGVPERAGTEVLLRRRDHQGVWHEHSFATQDGLGGWTAGRLPQGTYSIEFMYTAPHGLSYGEFWDDKATLAEATTVTVAGEQVVTGLGVVMDKVTGGPYYTYAAPPTVTGNPEVGEALTANPGTWTPAGPTFTYLWLADGVAILGATGATYVPTLDVVGRRISVSVTASGPLARTTTAVSTRTPPVRAVITNLSRPRITGKAKVGKKLKVRLGSWSPPEGVTFKVQWYADNKKITKATGTTLKLTRKLQGKKVSVRVTAVLKGADPATAKSRGVRVKTAHKKKR